MSEYEYRKCPDSPSHNNYFAELVETVTAEFDAYRDLFVSVNIMHCLQSNHFDLLGGIDKYQANQRIFGIAFCNDVDLGIYPKDSFEKNKSRFEETIATFKGKKDINEDYNILLKKFLSLSENKQPRGVVIVQTFSLEFTSFGGIIPKVTTKFENKIDFLGKDYMQSNIDKLEELYSSH